MYTKRYWPTIALMGLLMGFASPLAAVKEEKPWISQKTKDRAKMAATVVVGTAIVAAFIYAIREYRYDQYVDRCKALVSVKNNLFMNNTKVDHSPLRTPAGTAAYMRSIGRDIKRMAKTHTMPAIRQMIENAQLLFSHGFSPMEVKTYAEKFSPLQVQELIIAKQSGGNITKLIETWNAQKAAADLAKIAADGAVKAAMWRRPNSTTVNVSK